jgi:hypothetical protein
MTRPYRNRVSKYGLVATMETRIKSKAVRNAIWSARMHRNRTMGIKKNRDAPKNRLPPEIRNMTYALALDVNAGPAPKTLVPRPPRDIGGATHNGMSLLRVNK